MSRMTKYLKQKCTYEKLKRDSQGKVVLDKYGEPQYEAPVVVQCRKETTVQDVQTNTGAVLQSTTRYFTDESHAIQVNDRLEGANVLKVQQYVNQFGVTEGFESYV